MSRMRLLFAASEVYPFAKSGGLADVAHSLPRALGGACDVTVVMPLYRLVDRETFGIEPLKEGFDVTMGGTDYPVSLYGCRYEGVEYRFVYAPLLCEREYLYGPPERGYEDNALRFGLFSHAIVELAKRGAYDIAHLNDWQCGLAALLIREAGELQTKTLYTIHNLAYQGLFGIDTLRTLGIPLKHFTMEGVEFYGKVSFMKAGIGYADRVTTVSPTYAGEILTPEFGCGLEGYLRYHREKLSGIANGIDTEHFAPRADAALVQPYGEPSGKAANKRAFLERVGLAGEQKPLFIFIGRFTWQKGLDLLIDALPKMAVSACNIAILGEGEAVYRDRLRAIAESRSNVSLEFGYDEGLSHRMYAAADFLLMPSLFEPCGLNQMIAMHYGAVPLVHRVGGLADTVASAADFDPEAPDGYGIRFDGPTEDALLEAFDRALELYGDGERFEAVAAHNMGCDFSWRERAGAYTALYEALLEAR
jgi:starch synthase